MGAIYKENHRKKGGQMKIFYTEVNFHDITYWKKPRIIHFHEHCLYHKSEYFRK